MRTTFISESPADRRKKIISETGADLPKFGIKKGDTLLMHQTTPLHTDDEIRLTVWQDSADDRAYLARTEPIISATSN